MSIGSDTGTGHTRVSVWRRVSQCCYRWADTLASAKALGRAAWRITMPISPGRPTTAQVARCAYAEVSSRQQRERGTYEGLSKLQCMCGSRQFRIPDEGDEDQTIYCDACEAPIGDKATVLAEFRSQAAKEVEK